jgi:hypothetical protein
MKTLGSAVLVAALIGACGPAAVDAAHAVNVASDFVVAGQASGMILEDIQVGTPVWQTTHWRVQVDAVLDYPQPSQPVGRIPVHYLIDVDGTSGRATIFGQG